MKELTTSQEKVLSFISACQKAHGSPPTIREIAQHFGYRSLNNVRQHLRLIERKGHIRLSRGKARGVEVVTGLGAESSDLSDSSVLAEEGEGIQVPLVGSVPAGEPITAIENREGSITLDSNLFKGPGLFTLRVRGESVSFRQGCVKSRLIDAIIWG
jgi:repressor LexA